MSHITRVKTTLKDAAILEEALKKTGYHVHEQGLIFAGRNKQKGMRVEILAEKTGQRIGFRRMSSSESAYEIVADWEMQEENQREITRAIYQSYSREKVLNLAAKRGYCVIRDKLNLKGQIEIILRKVA